MRKKLCDLVGVSGYENNVSNFIVEYLNRHCQENIIIDNIGNVIYHKKGKFSDKRILFIAHIDEVGFQIIKKIDNEKYEFKTLGNIKMWNINHQIVEFSNGDKGIIYPYDQTIISGKNSENMYVEIVKSNGRNIDIGSTFTFENNFFEHNNCYVSKALDNRISCYCLLESLKGLKELQYDLFIAFTVMEEINMRGARVAISTIQPDIIINIDTSPIGKRNSLVLGNGIGIKLSDSIGVSDENLVNFIKRLAINNNIEFQLEVSDCGTSEIIILNENDYGAKNIALSIPCEHIHSSRVKVNKNDVQECIHLLKSIFNVNIE